ncbi:hypothetical protein M4L39_13715 [Staphylococcus equorum]|uniref:hypothetical protein n=1 Tax=Staphylococcus equorum TaxID=246432 RepID=UPI0024078C45|nr:hypothetical protein [Staphylococcus equorum]MDG0844471.1 hypothetical protein [Staphylococcus equorum]
MSNSENFREYPKILKIEDDGKIIALDRNGGINTDLYTHSITDDDSYRVFGKPFKDLYNKYIYLSRYEKNKETYKNDIPQSNRPEDFYTQRDRDNERNQRKDLQKSKNSKKWLSILLVIALIIIGFLLVKSYFFSNEQDNQDVANNEQMQQENEQLKQDINDTKSELQNSQQNEQQTQQSINELQTKVDNLKQNNQDQSAANEFQDGVNQLQEAQNSKENGNKNEMKEQLKQVEDKIDTEKISEESKNQWEKFKSWLNDNF